MNKTKSKNTGIASVYARDFVNVDGKHSWCKKANLKNKIAFMFFYSTSEEEIESISSGDLSVEEIKNLNLTSDTLHVHVVPKEHSTYIKKGEDVFLHIKFNFDFSKDVSNLAVFCCFVYNHPRSYTGQYVSNAKGPIASEYVINYSSPVANASVFVDMDENQWFGPVHYHEEKGYMEGATHTERPHKVLEKIDIPNVKLINNLSLNYEKKVFVKNKHFNTISNLFHSFGTDRNLKSMFAINYKDILLNETKYGNYLNLMDGAEFDKVLSSLNVIKFKILKSRVKSNSHVLFAETEAVSSRVVNGLLRETARVDKYGILYDVEVDDLESGVVESFSNSSKVYYEDYQEFSLCKIKESEYHSDGVKFYEFYDNTFVHLIGMYEYSIQLVMKDPTIKYVREMFIKTKESFANAKAYLTALMKSGNYDYELDKVSNSYISSEFYDDTLWKSAVDNFFKCYSMLFDIKDDGPQIKNSIISRVNPKSATLFSIKSFVSDYQKLIKNMYNTFNLTPRDITNSASSLDHKQLKNEARGNLISLKYKFKDKVDSIANKRFYSYLIPKVSEDILEINVPEYNNRVDIDMAKFPDTKKESSFSFLSPYSVHGGKYNIIMEDLEKVNVQELNSFFNKFDLIKQAKLYVEELPEEEKEFDQRFDLRDSSEYLGDDSDFVRYKEHMDSCFKFEEKYNFIKNLNMIASGGRPPQRSNSNNEPPQVNAFDVAYDRVGSLEADILLKINFFLLQQIEVFRGFDGGNLNLPIWELLSRADILKDSQKLFCRMRYYDKTASKVDAGLQLPQADRYFFLDPQQIELPPEPSMVNYDYAAFDKALRYDSDGSTSNIVMQGDNNPVFNELRDINSRPMPTRQGSAPRPTIEGERTSLSTAIADSLPDAGTGGGGMAGGGMTGGGMTGGGMTGGTGGGGY